MSMRRQEAAQLVEDLLNLGNLTKWEERFLMDMAGWLEQGRELTEKQAKALQELADRKL